MKDEVVAEIRVIRRQIEADFGNDYRQYLAHILKAQKEHVSPLTLF